jgi:hypothetical protein
VARTQPPVFLVSYARADTALHDYRKNLQEFVADLSFRVATSLAIPIDDVSFIDTDMDIGEVWTDSLADALMRCRVGVALYSPNYFARRWCGKEFQVLLDRRLPGSAGTGIVPVRWARVSLAPPKCAADIQYVSGAFPPEYASLGMQQLAKLKSIHLAQYEQAMNALTDRIVAEAQAAPPSLRSLTQLDFDAIKSAWEEAAAGDPQSHKRGSIAKTCFVFVSRDGWAWVPYEGDPPQIGALAQKIAGELGVRYEEIPCDAALPQKLKEAYDNDVPTVLFADPESLLGDSFMQPMRHYDVQYLLNCATLIAWESGMKDSIEGDARWLHLKTKVFKQKIESPPPYHEWRSIFSRDELDLKTRTLIEQIRSRLMKQLISDPGKAAVSRKMEDAAISRNAAARGISTAVPSNLEGPTR